MFAGRYAVIGHLMSVESCRLPTVLLSRAGKPAGSESDSSIVHG